MLREKISKIFKENMNNKKKTENLVFLLIILIITVVAINVIWKDEDKEDESNDPSKQLAKVEGTEKETTLEEKLEKILSKIYGVGDVEILITYKETEQIIPIYNTKDKTSVINETDSTGRK